MRQLASVLKTLSSHILLKKSPVFYGRKQGRYIYAIKYFVANYRATPVEIVYSKLKFLVFTQSIKSHPSS